MTPKSCKALLLLLQFWLLQTSASNADSGDAILNDERILQGDGTGAVPTTRTDLIRLVPFDVQIALNMAGRSSNTNFNHLNLVYLTDTVTEWMNEVFAMKAQADGLLPNTTSFSSVGLVLESPTYRRLRQNTDVEDRDLELVEEMLQDGDQRELQNAASTTGVFTAKFSGVSLWNRQGVVPMDPRLVELIQRATFLEANKLLIKLQLLDAATTGFGTDTLNVRAFITPDSVSTSDPNSDNSDRNLEIIIIIAIVVACSAFGLLLFAVVWAWKTDQSKQQHFKADLRSPEGTGSESNYSPKNGSGAGSPAGGGNGNKNIHRNVSRSSPQTMSPSPQQAMPPPPSPNRPPSEISPDNYPESVISEDISTALTAYYRSGMAGYGGSSGGSGGIHHKSRELNDAASMSSMDSYGYSLDGYAPSLSGGPTQMGYPVGPLGPVNGQIKDPDADDDVLGGVAPSSNTSRDESEP